MGYCTSCGAGLEDGARFCPSCGNSAESSNPATTVHTDIGSPPTTRAGTSPFVTQRSANGFAIASMVLGIVWVYWIGSILAVIFGHVSLKQFNREPDRYSGRGMAIAGLVLGYIGLATLVIIIVIAIIAASTDS